MNDSMQNQYIHWIEESTTLTEVKALEDKIIRNYGMVPEKIKTAIEKKIKEC